MRESAGRLLLVGWEIGNWEVLQPLIDDGSMPTLKRLVEEGVSGSLSSPPPALPASQWITIATGKRAWQHGHCAPAWNGRSNRQTLPAPRTARTVWEILSEQQLHSIAVGWPGTHGRNFAGISVSDSYHIPTAPPGKLWPTAGAGTYLPPDLGSRLDVFRISPQEIDSAVIAHYVPEWENFDQASSPLLSQLRILLAADFSYHAAMTALMEGEKWSFATVRFPAIGDICRLFGQHYLFAGTPSAKTDPALRNVIPSAYRTLDAMLGRLIQLAGPDADVVLVSPGGISASSPEAFGSTGEAWRTSTGIFVAAGKTFKRDSLVHGAMALDITPTILNWFDLPAGQDMEGRQIPGAFTRAVEVPTVETWERPGRDVEEGAAGFRRNLSRESVCSYDWNVAQSLLDAGRFVEALSVLEGLFKQFPENPTFVQTLFQTQLTLSRLADAEQTLEVMVETMGPELALLPQAELALARGNTQAARKLVAQLLLNSSVQNSPTAHRIGLLLIALRQWDTLETCARASLQKNESDEVAWLGLAEACIRRKDFENAAFAAKRAIGLKYYLPDGHFALARALVGMGMFLAAIQAIERLLGIDPTNQVAKNYLRRLRNKGAND